MTIKDMYTVGELAKKMKVSVRTLQYYDKLELLKPSAYSDGGRRLYASKDIVRLQQILSLKFLGLSLEEIGERLSSMQTPKQVEDMLEKQKILLNNQIKDLNDAISAIDQMQEELAGSKQVDFDRLAQIIILFRLKEDGYWWNQEIFSKNQPLKEQIQKQVKVDSQFGAQISSQFEKISNKMLKAVEKGRDPKGKVGQKLAKELWDMVQKFSGGDQNVIQYLFQFNEQKEGWPEEIKQRQVKIESFMGQALEYYMQSHMD